MTFADIFVFFSNEFQVQFTLQLPTLLNSKITQRTLHQVKTVAGGDMTGNKNGNFNLKKARFNFVSAIVAANDEGNFYVSDLLNHVIRKINLTNQTDEVLAGSQKGHKDGEAWDCKLNGPSGLLLSGYSLFIADRYNNCIRRFDLMTTIMHTYAGKPSESGERNGHRLQATFCRPNGICMDSSKNLYVCDEGNDAIRKVSVSGDVTTVLNNQFRNYAFRSPTFITPNPHNSQEFFFSAGNGIFKLTIRPLIRPLVELFAGSLDVAGYENHQKTHSKFYSPAGLCVHNSNLIVADSVNNVIRRVPLSNGSVSTLAGDGGARFKDGPLLESSFRLPRAILLCENNTIMVGDSQSIKIIC